MFQRALAEAISDGDEAGLDRLLDSFDPPVDDSGPMHGHDENGKLVSTLLYDALSSKYGQQESTCPPWWTTPGFTPEEVPEEDVQRVNQSAVKNWRGPFPSSRQGLKAVMRRRGFCEHQVQYLAQAFEKDDDLRHFAAMNRRLSRTEDHGPCLSHNRCIAYNSPIEAGTYRTQHTDNCSRDCYMVETPQSELFSTIRSGGVPLVSIHEDTQGMLSLRVHRRAFRTRYATISHVWADGLGNPDANALPACQVRRLKSLLESSEGHYPNLERLDVWNTVGGLCNFSEGDEHEGSHAMQTLDAWMFPTGRIKMVWMDTLCVPVNDNDLRQRCIDTMSSIYVGSSPVFVLDKELMATRVAFGRYDFANLYRIMCSAWMGRCWTLQEAVLPPNCVFQFYNELYQPSIDKGVKTSDMLRARFAGQSVSDSLFVLRSRGRIQQAFFDDFYLPAVATVPSLSITAQVFGNKYSKAVLWDRNIRATDLKQFTRIWNAFAGRTTTQTADLWVLLASCFDLKLFQFRDLQPPDSVERMVLNFTCLPLFLLYNTGPRLRSAEHHYNRWVPTELGTGYERAKSEMLLRVPLTRPEFRDWMLLHICDEVQVLYVDLTIPVLLDYILVDGSTLYQVHCDLDTSDQFDAASEGCIATCFFIEETELGRRGACLYVTAGQPLLDDQEISTSLELIYFCPIVVTLYDSGDVEGIEFAARSLELAVFRPERGHQFWVKLTQNSNFLATQHMKGQFSGHFQRAAIKTLFTIPFLSSVGLLVFGLIGAFIANFFVDGDSPLETYFIWLSYTPLGWLWNLPDIDSVLAQFAIIFAKMLLLAVVGGLCIYLWVASAGFVTVRLRDYIFLHKSYDDDAIADRFGDWLENIIKQWKHKCLQTFRRVRRALCVNRERNQQDERALHDYREEGEERAEEERREEDDRRSREARRESLRRAARRGKRFGKQSWVFFRNKVIPIMIWPFEAMIEGVDAMSRWQVEYNNRRRHVGPVHLQ